LVFANNITNKNFTMTEDEPPTRRRRARITIDNGDGSLLVGGELKTLSRRGKKRRPRDLDPPFHILVIQVGTTLLILCLVTYYLWQGLFPSRSFNVVHEEEAESIYGDDAAINAQLDPEAVEAAAQTPTQAPTIATAPPLPVWDLGEAARYDAFGIAEYHKQSETGSNTKTFWSTAESLRNQFAELYGGENAVRAMMERGLSVFPINSDSQSPPSDLISTACRIRQAKEEQRPFRFTFGGYSVTVGRGNYFGQVRVPKVQGTLFRQQPNSPFSI
jgi:hypothetical protein